MAKDSLTEVAIVMDESGSMMSTVDDAIGGFNSFLASQKEVDGEANITLVLFDNKYEIVHDGIDLNDIPDLNRATFVPGGGTALIDAIGKTIDSLSSRISEMAEEDKPGKTIIIVITDGQENSSREYKRSEVAEKIKSLKSESGWEMIFIGASEEILDQADDIGIAKSCTMKYDATSKGTAMAYDCMSAALTSYRTEGSCDISAISSDSKWKKTDGK
jgi:uncharacterized protein YegL